MENVLKIASFSLESTKPLIKEFYDSDAEIAMILKIRLPSIYKAIPKVTKLFTSTDKLRHKYRVNWYADVETEFMTMKKIVASKYIEVITSKDGVFESFNIIG